MSLNFLFILTLCKKGPGTYPTLPALNEKGKYVISKYRGSGCGVINPRSKRFELCIVFIIKLG
jgi:hypothetical protein